MVLVVQVVQVSCGPNPHKRNEIYKLMTHDLSNIFLCKINKNLNDN